jgi:hypothetical protein
MNNMNIIGRFFHYLAGHTWFYFENAGVGDFLKRTCSKCGRKETYRGNRGYNHPKDSNEWMTDEEYAAYLKEWERVKNL